MEMKLSQTAEQYQGALREFLPFPKGAERDAYENLPAPLKEALVKEGSQYLGYEYPAVQQSKRLR